MNRVSATVAESAALAGDWLRAVLPRGADLSLDSRRIRPGDGFIAVPGASDDGRAHVADAIARGAAAIAYDPQGDRQLATTVPTRAIAQLRFASGHLAASYYEHPSARLRVIAVTGTNGKTSCSQWIARGLAALGQRCGVVGTLGSAMVDAEDELSGFGLTTPDAVSTQRMFAQFVRRGAGVVAIEASSIGLDQQRLAGTEVDTAVFTNISRDHLDYHGDMAAYVEAKRSLFATPGLRAAVINGNDAHAKSMLDAFGDRENAIVYGERPLGLSCGRARRLEAVSLEQHGDSMRVGLAGEWGEASVSLALLGRFNASNALAVAGAWLAVGVERQDMLEQLGRLRPIEGRMQRIVSGAGPLVLVDYAHTPDALEQALAALRPVAAVRGGRLVCIFGAGGERDRGKRALMARAAEQGADQVVVTSDNPRGESAAAIAADISAGFESSHWHLELDRYRAITQTIAAADDADLVLIAGKGHESFQEIAGVRHPFSDAEVALRALRRGEAE